MSQVGLTTDRDLSVSTCLRNTTSFIPLRYQKSHGTNHYTKKVKCKQPCPEFELRSLIPFAITMTIMLRTPEFLKVMQVNKL